MYFTEHQKAGFNLVLPGFSLKVWIFTKINFRTTYLGILVDMKYMTKIYEIYITLKRIRIDVLHNAY